MFFESRNNWALKLNNTIIIPFYWGRVNLSEKVCCPTGGIFPTNKIETNSCNCNMHARHKWGMFPWKREAFGFIYEFWQQTKSRWWRRGSDFGFSGVWNFMLALSDMIAINTLLQWASLEMSHYRGTEDTVKSNRFSSWLSKIETIGPCYLPNFIVHTSSRVLSNTKTKRSRPKEKNVIQNQLVQ